MQDDSLLKQAFEEKFYYVEDEHTKVIPKPSEVNFDPNFIGPRTEVGQEIYELYEQELLKLARDPVFIEYVKNNNDTQKDERELLISFIEQIGSKCPELEQKYGSDVQPENSNKEKKTGRLDPKQLQLFQQENETKNDESSTESDTQHEDNNKKSEASDSKTSLSPRLLSSNNNENAESSDNKKSLLALRASNEEYEGYKADEEELEESNNKAEEELKKDMLLESENKAIDIPLKTEEIVEQGDTVLKEQISNKTNETVALLEGVDRMTW